MNQMAKPGKKFGLWAYFLLLVLLSLFAVGAVFADDDDDDDDDDAIPNQVVVKLQAGAAINLFNDDYGTITIMELAPGRLVYLLEAADGTDMEALIELMEDDPRVIYAEPNLLIEQPEADRRSAWAWGGHDSQPYGEQYALEMIHLLPAHLLSRGAGTVVAVIDTGVQLNHPALAGSLTAAQYDLIDGDGVPNDEGNGLDDDGDGEVDEGTGHGTHVAGIVNLVAPEAQIMPIRALDSDGQGNVFAIAEAVLFALENGAHVVNVSLGMSGESEVLEETIEEAAEQGVLVVAAAGNLNSNQRQYPAADECVLAITSVGPTGARSAFANYGSWISLSAPGESIYSPFPVNGYAWWSGTSMATPFAAGQAVLLLSIDPSLTVVEVADYMGGTAQSVDAANPGASGLLGAGLLDVQAALQALSQGQPPSPLELLDDDCADD